jgi:YfiH family protein
VSADSSGREPGFLAGVPVWDESSGPWRIRFLGRGAGPRAGARPPEGERAWLRQVHGDRIVAARPGECGEADGLLVDAAGVVAAIATADCVPVALVAGERAALVHAGWRGIAAGIVERAVERLAGDGAVHAFLGPAIGPCCYEVGPEVAEALRRAADESAIVPASRPHAALHAAIRFQLARAGARTAGRIAHCTRCRPEWLESHRRDREAAGRNWSLLWREA